MRQAATVCGVACAVAGLQPVQSMKTWGGQIGVLRGHSVAVWVCELTGQSHGSAGAFSSCLPAVH